MQKGQEFYDSIMDEAEAGNPHAMLELAKLYKIGVFQDESDEHYIHWLRQFISSPLVGALLTVIEADDEDDFNEDYFKCQEIVDSLGLEAEAILQSDIIEAGVSLGLYFRNSTDREELVCARTSLYSAFVASRFDYMEVPEAHGVTDILSILSVINKRIEKLGYMEEIS